MNIKKLNKKILVSVLSSLFVFGAAFNFVGSNMNIVNVYAEESQPQSEPSNVVVQPKDEIELYNKVNDGVSNTGNPIKFYFQNNTATIKISNYKVDSHQKGYLLLDINKDFVKGYSSKYFSSDKKVDDAMRVTTNFSTNMPDTVIKEGYCSYSAKNSGYVRFYLPYNNADGGDMTITFTIPQSVQDKINKEIENAKKSSDKIDAQKKAIEKNRTEVILFSEKVDDENLLKPSSGELVYNGNEPKSGFVNVETYSNYEKEKLYKGFVFSKDNNTLRIKPDTKANKIRLYLGAGNDSNGFSYSNGNGEFDIKYYNNGHTYRKVNDGKVHSKNEFKDNEYKRTFMSLSRGFNSVDIPLKSNDGIIEIKLNNANNFLLNLKVLSIYENGSSVNNISTPNATVPSQEASIDATAVRYSGSDRYDTSLELSKKVFSKSEVAVVASGQNFADALAGGGLAAIKNAPLLLVNDSKSVVDNVNRELRRLGVREIYLLGGKNSVSINTEMKLTNDKDNNDKARKVTRLYGKNRYETSYEIYREVNRSKDSKEKPILVNGRSFADALSAGALAGYTKRGIVLTDGHNLISGYGLSKTDEENIIIGGLSSMDNSFKGKRISGVDRYATSVNVANYLHNTENVLIASGETYPDGLSSISLYGKYNAPLLLTRDKELPSVAKKYIKNNKIKNVYIIGGTNSVSAKVKNIFK